MTKQEELREYFEGNLCSDLSQEYCSGCNFTRKNSDFCEMVKERITDKLTDLAKLGLVIKVDKPIVIEIDGKQVDSTLIIGTNVSPVQPLIE